MATIAKGGLYRNTYQRNDFLDPFLSKAPLKRKMIKEGDLTESLARMAFLLDSFLYLPTDMI